MDDFFKTKSIELRKIGHHMEHVMPVEVRKIAIFTMIHRGGGAKIYAPSDKEDFDNDGLIVLNTKIVTPLKMGNYRLDVLCSAVDVSEKEPGKWKFIGEVNDFESFVDVVAEEQKNWWIDKGKQIDLWEIVKSVEPRDILKYEKDLPEDPYDCIDFHDQLRFYLSCPKAANTNEFNVRKVMSGCVELLKAKFNTLPESVLNETEVDSVDVFKESERLDCVDEAIRFISKVQCNRGYLEWLFQASNYEEYKYSYLLTKTYLETAFLFNDAVSEVIRQCTIDDSVLVLNEINDLYELPKTEERKDD